ncbi:MAG: DUF3500 domain-containing protein [Proteobacteria bacterium]|nr:DUF3500 domain-containing protein [Pseudomonadota bacterium]
MFLYIVAGIVVLLVGLGTIAFQLPVATSKVVWPLIEDRMLEEPFIGVTSDGIVKPDLYRIESTGVSTEPVVQTAEKFIAALNPQQRNKLLYAVDDDEWRRWANIHISTRQGVGLLDMDENQTKAAFNLLEASLSARGLDTSHKIIKLEGHLADLMDDHNQYGSQRYWFTIMGTPSQSEPWGWQLDGHHLIINYFVLGDQVVMSPVFMGSEPVRALSGPHAGTEILQEEQEAGLALIRSLSEQQRAVAITSSAKPGNNNYGELFQDNAVVPVAGISLDALDDGQRALAVGLISLYVDNLKRDHAQVRLTEILKHWSQTYFSWVGGTGDDAVFYYRIMSPVIMIEFDHQSPVALEGDGPSRIHVHTVVRTPNGNDYGKDLLRQHLVDHPH